MRFSALQRRRVCFVVDLKALLCEEIIIFKKKSAYCYSKISGDKIWSLFWPRFSALKRCR